MTDEEIRQELEEIAAQYGNHCDVCCDDIFMSDAGKWHMRIENGNWDERNDCYDYVDIEIKYCYRCGKKYEEE